MFKSVQESEETPPFLKLLEMSSVSESMATITKKHVRLLGDVKSGGDVRTGDSDVITEDETATGGHHACQGHVQSGPPFIGPLRSDHVHHTPRHSFFLFFVIPSTHNTPPDGRRFQGHSRGQCLANLPLLRQVADILRCMSIIANFLPFEAPFTQPANLADSPSKLAESSTFHR